MKYMKIFPVVSIISALNKESPDFNFIKGNSNMSIGAASKMRPAKTSTNPSKIDRITIKNLIFLEIFWVLAFAKRDKTRAKIIKIIIPKKTKFIY